MRGSFRVERKDAIPTVLHAHDEVLGRLLDQLDIGDRVAVNQQRVDPRNFLTRIGVLFERVEAIAAAQALVGPVSASMTPKRSVRRTP